MRTIPGIGLSMLLAVGLVGCGSAGPDGALSPEASESAASAPTWPTATSTVTITATQNVSGTFDGGMKRYVGAGDLGTDGSSESQLAMFVLADGATLQNVILGSPAADGVHCKGTCTLKNVWWEDVGEDAATMEGSSSGSMTIDGGGARAASDKIFQHNGSGTMTIKNFYAESFGKLYRACGNCKSGYQGQRHVVIQNIVVTKVSTAIAGINSNYGDTADMSGITVLGDSSHKTTICVRYQGNNTGAEPTKLGSGPGSGCNYDPNAISWDGSTTASYALSVTKAGTGSGTVTSNTGGISCGSTCSAAYTSGTSVTLTASAASGSTFAGWSGSCSGTSTTCTVSMSAARSVTATFNTSGGTSSGPCANPVTLTSGNSGSFNTSGAACYRTAATISGWGCYNMDGRTVSVNGAATTCGAMPVSKWTDGYTYFAFGAGAYAWAGFYYW